MIYVRNRATGDRLRSAPPGIEEFLNRHVSCQLKDPGVILPIFFHVRMHRNVADGMKHVRDLSGFHTNGNRYLQP